MQDELNRLYRLYYERDKEFEKAKGRRTLLSVLGFSVWYFWIYCNFLAPSGIREVLLSIVFAIITSVFHVLINGTIFWHLIDNSRREYERLEHIKKQIQELEKKQH